MGRPAKPVDLMVVSGSSHLTKEEIQKRKQAEIKLNRRTLKPDALVKGDPRALKEFRILKELYADISYVGELDNHLINQYCLAVSELDDLALLMSDFRKGVAESRRSKDKAQLRTDMETFLQLDVEVRQKRAEIMKLGDRLYLNPTARTKNIPRAVKEEDDPNASMFGDG